MNDAECKSYLYRIATNLMRDRWRGQGREAALPAKEEGRDERLEARTELRQAFHGLKAREKQLLWLAYVEGQSHDEIAEVTGLKSGSIRLLLFRARHKLAELLRSKGKSAEVEAEI